MNQELLAQVETALAGATEETPVHWSDLVKRFVGAEGNCPERSALVGVMNFFLLPQGKLVGRNHKYWWFLPQTDS